MPSDDGQMLHDDTIALSLEGVEEYPHAGLPAFRVWRSRPRFSWRLGKDGTHAQDVLTGTPPNCVETAN
jgi:hypothetical protein